MFSGNFNDLARRTASDKVLRDKAINIAKNPEYDGYQRGWFINFLVKRLRVIMFIIKSNKMSN